MAVHETVAALDLAGLLHFQAVPLDHIPSLQFQALGIDFGKLLDPKVFLNPLQELAKQLIVVSRSLAFIMLVWSMMSRLSGHQHGEFWPTILRGVVLTAIMGLGNQLIYMVDNEVNLVLAMPIHVTSSDGAQITDSLGATPDMISQRWSKIFGEVQNPVPQTSQQNQGNSNGGVVGTIVGAIIPGANEVSGLWNEAKNIAWNIIHAIWRGVQLLAVIFLSGLYLLQRILLIAGGVYYPIAIGQMGSRTLRNTGLNFLLSYLGLFAWPIGWGIVNLGVLVAIATNPARTNVTMEDLLRSLMIGLPVIFWIILGYILAPFCIQKVVAKGGAAIQGFLSTSIMGSLAAGMLAKGLLADRLLGGRGSGGNQPGAQTSNSGQGMGMPVLPWVGGSNRRSSASRASGDGATGSDNAGESAASVKASRADGNLSNAGSWGGRRGAQSGNGAGGRFSGMARGLGAVMHTMGDLSAEASGEPHAITPGRLMRSVGPTSSERARQYLP
jgi:hypothetical protein